MERPDMAARHRRRARMMERTDVLCLAWWAVGGPLLSRTGLAAVLSTLADVLPEAVPIRWDLDESFGHSLEQEGFEALVDFLDANRDEHMVVLRAKSPARSITLYAKRAGSTDPRHGSFRVPHLMIELDAAVLDRRGASERLPQTFERLSDVMGVFYAEARMLRNVAKHPGAPIPASTLTTYPFRWNQWYGLPVSPPFAAVVGDPYLPLWPAFGNEEVGGMRLWNPRPWTRDIGTLAWEVPEGLCQPFDCRWTEVEQPAWMSSEGQAWRFEDPDSRAPLWPLVEPTAPPPVPGIVEAPPEDPGGDEEIRQVSADEDDGEAVEVWERTTAEPDIRAVWARKIGRSHWSWEIDVAVLEFVREEPLETDLSNALEGALSAVPAVTAVGGADRETLIVAGSPTGRDLMEAVTGVIDSMADRLRQHYRGH